MPSNIQPVCVFISGKNWKLSLAELVTFLETRKVKFEVRAFFREFFVVGFEEKAEVAIADLGGIIKIGEVTANLATEIAKEAFLQKNKEAEAQVRTEVASSGLVDAMLKRASSEKIFFGVSVYCAEDSLRPVSRSIQRFIGSSIKRELAGYGRKSKFMGFSKDRKQPQLSHIEVLKKCLVENKAETLFCIGKEQTWLSTTVGVHNPFEFQKRDIGKPSQRKIFAIPPRLARIMINLASCAEGKVLLDPFCGVGTILQEALLAKARVIGVDLNPWCVEAARENLDWVKREYRLKKAEFFVVQGDARRLAGKIKQEVDCIVTEPDLGPALRDIATTPYATKIIDKLNPLYHSFLEEAYRALKKDGRLVLVSPYVKTRSGKPVTMRLQEKAMNVGFEIVHPFHREIFLEGGGVREDLVEMASFVDAEERHLIGREIHVFQK